MTVQVVLPENCYGADFQVQKFKVSSVQNHAEKSEFAFTVCGSIHLNVRSKNALDEEKRSDIRMRIVYT